MRTPGPRSCGGPQADPLYRHALGSRGVGLPCVYYLSATARGYGEPARFRPGGVVDLDTGCSVAFLFFYVD